MITNKIKVFKTKKEADTYFDSDGDKLINCENFDDGLTQIAPEGSFVALRIGKKAPHWKGGKIIKEDGYILIFSPNHPYKNNTGYVREHRLVMEKEVRKAVARKELKPIKEVFCSECGSKAIEYHHPDYTKPLLVIPLCKICHEEVHHVK